MISALLLMLTQAAAAATSPAIPTTADARLEVCMEKARNDPATAISEANDWLSGLGGEDRSHPQQCLGMAYTSLLRWEAAEQAFLAARNALPASAAFRRAQLATMAGNAALADKRGAEALTALDLAVSDAKAAGDTALEAIAQVDRSRALVAQGATGQAEVALASARTLDPQNPYAWLLSATLSRRLDKLEEAQTQIETAASLAPDYPEIGLEAGVIAMLRGNEAAAAQSWRSVVALEPNGEAAATARGYLAQLGDVAGEAPVSR